MSTIARPTPTDTSLAGRVALVTGGSRGIGAAIALRLARDGADVAITYATNAAAAAVVVDQIRGLGRRGVALQADAVDPAVAADAVHRTLEALDRLDIVVNNAGVAGGAPLPEVSDEFFEHMLSVNVRAPFAVARAASKVLPRGGRIINIGSVNAGWIPLPGVSTYGMTKAALAALSRGWARELGEAGISVTCVQPGPIDTDLNPADGPRAALLTPMTALGRYGQADEVAALVAHLASDAGEYMTGAVVDVAGGAGL